MRLFPVLLLRRFRRLSLLLVKLAQHLAEGYEVVFQGLAFCAVVERGSGVEDGKDEKFARPLHAAVQARNAHLRLQDELCGKLTERDQDFRVDGTRLLAKERRAGLDFLGSRVAISGRAALQHVGDEYVLAAQAGAPKQLVEVVPGGTDERLALQILVFARRLADEHHTCVRVANAEYRLRTAVAQRAAAA